MRLLILFIFLSGLSAGSVFASETTKLLCYDRLAYHHRMYKGADGKTIEVCIEQARCRQYDTNSQKNDVSGVTLETLDSDYKETKYWLACSLNSDHKCPPVQTCSDDDETVPADKIKGLIDEKSPDKKTVKSSSGSSSHGEP